MIMNKVIISVLLLIPLHAFSQTTSPTVCKTTVQQVDNSDVINCYRQQLASRPLNYKLMSSESLPKNYQYLLADLLLFKDDNAPMKPPVQVKRYKMISQTWSPLGLVTPAQWVHNVNIYIPDQVKSKQALLAINLSEKMMIRVAQSTHSVVVSLDNIPSVDLIYQGDLMPRNEDDSIARSWGLYMQHPEGRTLMPLNVPMAAAVSQTIRLAQQELKPLNIDKFIVAGASKRGWTAWLAAISDPSIVAIVPIVPIVADFLDTQNAIKNMSQSLGGHFPVTFKPYYQHQIDLLGDRPEFISLMEIVDPLKYLDTPYASRFSIPKYIINASGDDFFPPDNTRYYYDKLPGVKSLRIVPNSDHFTVNYILQDSLITFVNRLQGTAALPEVNATMINSSSEHKLHVSFSEQPVKVVQWTAINKTSRDMRYACGVRYTPSSLATGKSVDISLQYQGEGWQATFVEATFDDGYISTSQVYITPDDKYPTVAPASVGKNCQTLEKRVA